MANLNDSIEQLTRALQQLTAELAESGPPEQQRTAPRLPADRLKFSKGVEKFVQRSLDYADKTRSISVGTY